MQNLSYRLVALKRTTTANTREVGMLMINRLID